MASPITSKIGTGMLFPIQITTAKDNDGNDILIPKVDENGNPVFHRGEPILVPKTGWYPVTGDPALIQNNLKSIFIYQLGERFRQENFGSRFWEALEDPNDNVLQRMLDLFIKSSIASWEPRIRALDINLERKDYKLYIHLQFAIGDSSTQSNLTLEYNSITTESNAY